MQESFADLFEGIEALQSVEFVQTGSQQSPIINKTKFNNPPVPKTKVPANPCNDPDQGAPSTSKRGSKCVLTGASCYKLQERFLLIQSGIQDDRDSLQEDIESMTEGCNEQSDKLQSEIQ